MTRFQYPLLGLLALACWTPALAHENFVTNPYLPYPSGCAGDPARKPVPFIEGQAVALFDLQSKADVQVRLDAWRSTCSEPDRSVIWLRFTAKRPSQRLLLKLPKPWAQVGKFSYEQRLAAQPGGWGVVGDLNRDSGYLVYDPAEVSAPAERSWTFVLDGPIQDGWGMLNVYDFEGLSAAQYNQAFTLRLNTYLTIHEFDVPATRADRHTEPGMPLNGRLSGLWAIDGAADQGVTLTIADRIAPADTPATPRGEGPLVLILQQYTFDAEGNLLWLTGAGDFAQGAQAVSFPVVRVDGGAFLGDTAAQRDIVGTVRIVANGCNDLDYEYDLTAIGLGSGSRKLHRLFSLETAGYDCRDYAAKVAANR